MRASKAFGRFHIFSVVCLLSVCCVHACDWGVETHTYIMRNTRTITYLLLCNVKLHLELRGIEIGIGIGIRMQSRHCDNLVSADAGARLSAFTMRRFFQMQTHLYRQTHSIKCSARCECVCVSRSQWKLNIGNDIKRLFKFKYTSLAQSATMNTINTHSTLKPARYAHKILPMKEWVSACEFIPSLLIQMPHHSAHKHQPT